MILKHAAVFAVFLMLLPFAEAADSLPNANVTISNALKIINEANQSAYLIFAPNLASSYYYINEAMAANNSSKAISLAMQAEDSARSEMHRINSYAAISIAVTGLLALAVFTLLYIYMKPIKIQSHKQSRKHL
ncbi:MAG: hypothetical protein QXN16_02015 [Candidatus Micrarchaeaceae archaeon]